MNATRSLALLVAGACLAACTAGERSVDWPTPGGDTGKTRHSNLDQIDTGNVDRLGLAWEVKFDTYRGLEATPVVVDGVMYTSGNAGRAYAFDATNGGLLWRFVPEVDMQVTRTVCCDMVNRGVAVGDGKVFVASLDGVLYALDAADGSIVWQADTVDDHARGVNITGAPEIADQVVIIGNGGAEYDVRGYVSAYDLESGELAWRFYTVPSDPAAGPQASPELGVAVRTWDPDSRWDVGGGGTAWDAIHYDPEFGAVYIGTGNGGPYSLQKRSPVGGDNLFLSSIVALDPATGRMKWYYQETPGDSWDFTATSPMILTRLDVDGEKVPALIHAPKNGFMYVIDRRDGSVIEAHSLVYQNWADGVDPATGRPNMTPGRADYSTGPKIVFPASPGARNWHPAAYSAKTGLYYASVLDMGNLVFMPPGRAAYRQKALNVDAALIFGPDIIAALPTLPPPMQEAVLASPELKRIRERPAVSEIRAIDPLTGETAWAQPMAGWQDRGGVLSTAGGLVFQGSIDGTFKAYDAGTGEILSSIQTGTSMLAAPMTYSVDSVQYVAIMAAWGGGGWPFVPRYSAAYRYSNQGRLLVFRLDGGEVPLPAELPPLTVAPEPPEQIAGTTAETLANGRMLFLTNCSICHSNQHRSLSPDLRRMRPETHDIFGQIVRDGLLVSAGMPSWGDLLSDAEIEAIHAYLIDLQGPTRERELALQEAGKPLDEPSLVILSGY